MTKRRVKTVAESGTGRNKTFQDTSTGTTMSRAGFVKAINAGRYPDYHVRNLNGVKTPASNPDGQKNNNLG